MTSSTLARTKSLGQNDVTLSGLARQAAEHFFQNGSCRCQILGFSEDLFLGIIYTLEAETLVKNLIQYKLFIGDDKKNMLFGMTFSLRLKQLGNPKSLPLAHKFVAAKLS